MTEKEVADALEKMDKRMANLEGQFQDWRTYIDSIENAISLALSKMMISLTKQYDTLLDAFTKAISKKN